MSESNSHALESSGCADDKADILLLKACQVCGRNFNLQSLERHEKICEKTKKSNHRTVFNSFLQRAKEINAVPVINAKKKEESKSKGKWKEEHENILCAVRAAKIAHSGVMNNGLSPQKIIPSGYQQCPSCNRCFNEKAADRHITWCQEQQSRLPKTPPNSEALDRLKARVKYRAPRPLKKLKNTNARLVKSADSVRMSTVLRTHSSPPIPMRDASSVNQNMENVSSSVTKHKEAAKRTNNNSDQVSLLKMNSSEVKGKKTVKFKEKFPIYNKDRNKNLEMLAALRQRLSELNTSDDFLDDCIGRLDENEHLKRNPTMVCSFPSPALEMFKDCWTSDGEIHCNTSSSSDRSLPSLSYNENTEKRMPRFCYNCGTKYPIVSAKFCCECGARRFIFGANDNPVHVN